MSGAELEARCAQGDLAACVRGLTGVELLPLQRRELERAAVRYATAVGYELARPPGPWEAAEDPESPLGHELHREAAAAARRREARDARRRRRHRREGTVPARRRQRS